MDLAGTHSQPTRTPSTAPRPSPRTHGGARGLHWGAPRAQCEWSHANAHVRAQRRGRRRAPVEEQRVDLLAEGIARGARLRRCQLDVVHRTGHLHRPQQQQRRHVVAAHQPRGHPHPPLIGDAGVLLADGLGELDIADVHHRREHRQRVRLRLRAHADRAHGAAHVCVLARVVTPPGVGVAAALIAEGPGLDRALELERLSLLGARARLQHVHRVVVPLVRSLEDGARLL